MKKFLAAVMVLTGGAAFAQVDATDVGPTLKEEAKDIGKESRENVKELGRQAGMATKDEGTFAEKKAFKIDGTLKDTGREEITLSRAGLPDAVLDVRNETKVMLDGKKVNAKDLPEGSKVSAWFQLEGEETVAVKLDAKKAGEAIGGAGEAGADEKAKKKMHKAADETQGELEETEDELQR